MAEHLLAVSILELDRADKCTPERFALVGFPLSNCVSQTMMGDRFFFSPFEMGALSGASVRPDEQMLVVKSASCFQRESLGFPVLGLPECDFSFDQIKERGTEPKLCTEVDEPRQGRQSTFVQHRLPR